ncbi:MAG: PQQ-binding-like beta-propeller repeat protein, partial [Planctomycetaceae bacterium]|nr:PQQ-binding-like beta-propeller repeat protein [Planctomycetaceae bacterium]
DSFHETELWIARLVKHKKPQLAARGLAHMVELCLKFHLDQDAEYYLSQLADYDPHLQISPNQTLQQFREQKQQATLTAEQQHKRKPWHPQKLKLIVGNPVRYYSTPEITLNTSTSSLPFFQTRTLAVEPKQNRLTVITPDGGHLIWSTPLRSSDLNRSPGFNESEVVGHNLILQHRDMLHLFDLVSQKLVWSQKLEKEQTNRYYPSSYRLTPAPMGSESSLVLKYHPSIDMRNIGMIAAANADYTCYYSRRKIILIDTRTGKIRWTHENVDNETRVLGDDQMIYLVTRDRITRKILRVSDGQLVPTDQAGDAIHNAIYQGETAFVSISSPHDKKLPGQKAGQTAVYSFHPQSKEQNWNLEFPRDTQFGLFNQHYLSALTPPGELSIVD